DVRQFDAGHNYHQGSREAVYAFFGRTLLGDADERNYKEPRVRVEAPADLLALWGRTLPDGAVDRETFLEQRIAEAEAGIARLRPVSPSSLDEARLRFGEWLELSLMAAEPDSAGVWVET